MSIAKFKIYCISTLLLLILIASVAFAQSDSTDVSGSGEPVSIAGVEIQTSISKAEVYIGDLVEYNLTIIYDSLIELTPPPLGANLGAFDVKDYQPDIESTLKDGRIKSENKFVLSTFTTGNYVIPAIPIHFTLADGSQKIMFSESVPIKVISLLFDTDEDQEIKPLKPQYEFKRDYTWYYILGSALLILLLLAGFLIRRRMLQSTEESAFVDRRPAWEIAFEKLAFLKQNDYITKSEFKSYYIDLTEIVRLFHEKVYKQNYTDMTTEELLTSFKELELPESLYDDTKNFLHHADLVKFAKYIPDEKRAESDYQLIHLMIEKVRVDVLKKEEEQQLLLAQQEKNNATINKDEVSS